MSVEERQEDEEDWNPSRATTLFKAREPTGASSPKLKKMTSNLDREYILTPKDDESATFLRRLPEVCERVILPDDVRRHKAVLERYFVNLLIKVVQAYLHVISARRLQVKKDDFPMRQVLVVYEELPPHKL